MLPVHWGLLHSLVSCSSGIGNCPNCGTCGHCFQSICHIAPEVFFNRCGFLGPILDLLNQKTSRAVSVSQHFLTSTRSDSHVQCVSVRTTVKFFSFTLPEEMFGLLSLEQRCRMGSRLAASSSMVHLAGVVCSAAAVKCTAVVQSEGPKASHTVWSASDQRDSSHGHYGFFYTKGTFIIPLLTPPFCRLLLNYDLLISH